jgi:ankyrin repeat protein
MYLKFSLSLFIGALSSTLLSTAGCRSLTEDGQSSLFRAASDGDERKASSLIAAGVNVNAREEERETPLMYAAAAGRSGMVVFLLKKGADINAVSANGETALVRAAGETETARILLDHGANVELGAPLIHASYAGYLDTVKLLLTKGANPNAQLLDGDTALIATVVQGTSRSKEIIKELIAAGARVEPKNKQGKTAEMLATENNRADLAELLREARSPESR